MTPDILNILKDFSTLGVLALAIYAIIPVLKSLAEVILKKGNVDKTNQYITQEINKIKNNELTHLEYELVNMRKEFRECLDDLNKEVSLLKERVARLEIKVFNTHKYE